MKSIFCCLPLALSLTHAGAQGSTKDSVMTISVNDKAMTKVEIESSFPGGPGAWLKYLNDHLKYPNKAARKRIEGTVLLQFIVDKQGNVSDLQALSGDPILQEAALKAMKDSPKWTPAIQNGQVVKSYKKQPIVFKLEAK